MKTKNLIASVTMNGIRIGTIAGSTSAGSTPWGLSHTINSIIKLCGEQGIRMIGNEFDVTFPSGRTWGWKPRG